MGLSEQIYGLINDAFGGKNVRTYNVLLAEFVDDLETSIFLSQLMYWTDRATRPDGFIYKRDEDWHNELWISVYAVRKARKKLESMGILETKIKRANGSPTVHYKLNKSAFTSQFIRFLRNRKIQLSDSQFASFDNEETLTKSTTESTDKELNRDHNASVKTDDRRLEQTGHIFSNEDKAMKDILSYYYETYRKNMHKTHPKLKVSQLEKVYNNITEAMRSYDIDPDTMKELINEWFEDQSVETDYNLNHFAQDGILRIRLHRIGVGYLD